MNEAIIVAIITAIPPTIMGLATFLQSRKSIKKADEIHILVNSNMSILKTELEVAKTEVLRLQKLLLNKP